MPAIRGERQLVERFVAWVEQTCGESLDYPAEFAALLDSRWGLPDSTAGTLRVMEPGHHTFGAAVLHLNQCQALASAIDGWSLLPAASRPSLADYLHHSVSGLLKVPLADAEAWLRRCLAPVAADLAARLGQAPGARWAAVCQRLDIGAPVPAA